MQLSHALPAIDDAVFRLGLPHDEIAYLLEAEVEYCHLLRGQRVRAHVSLDPYAPSLTVYRVPPLGSTAPEIPIHTPLQPTPQSFLARLEAYQRARAGQAGWEVALATCVRLEEGFSVVELADHPQLAGDVAVLPHARLTASDRATWRKGVARYVAVCRAPLEHRDGSESWRVLEPRWLATRADSIFLRLLIARFMGVEEHTDLYGGIGMVVLSEHADLGGFVGQGGQHIHALQALSGARQIVVVREPGPHCAAYRLKSAITQLTAARPFRLISPGEGSDVWSIVVRPDTVKRLVGVGGCRLMFVSRLARVRVKVVERAAI